MVRPAITVGVVFLVFTSIFAYIVRLFELPLMEFDLKDFILINGYMEAFYLTLITITTVGYGDIVPHTYPGKITMMVTAGLGAVIVAFVISIVQNHFEFNDKQLKVYH